MTAGLLTVECLSQNPVLFSLLEAFCLLTCHFCILKVKL
jgi:hypothetical protein